MNFSVSTRFRLFRSFVLSCFSALFLFGIVSQSSGQTLVDYDGNEYQTVIIGYQEWMAENLRTTRFSDGTAVAYPGDDIEAWQADTTGAYAWYNNDSDWATRYGALYNWHAVNSDHGLCPDGWRIPDNDDLWELYHYAMDNLEEVELSDVGNVLKSCRQVNSPLGGACDTDEHPRWNSHSTHYGTDDLGFSATPGGVRNENGGYFFMGRSGYFWTADPSGTAGRAIALVLNNHSSSTATTHADQISGFSVRCLRNVVAELPEVGTVHDPSHIRATHATSGGIVTNDGGAPVTARGVVWSQSVTPTLENNEGKTIDGTGTGPFTSRMLGLQPATTYHVRAYATNIEGTRYSEAATFTTRSSVETTAVAPDGSGTEQDPHLVSTLNHLVWVAENPAVWDRHYRQTADIDASATSDWPNGRGWKRIGTGTLSGFTGVYDGDGHLIDALYINADETGQGLFGYITNGAVVKNLGITNADIHGGEWYVGALIGYSESSTIDACFSTGTVRGTDTNVGGLVGRLHYRDEQGSVLSNSYSTCDVSGVDRVGGLVGVNAPGSVIRHSYSTGQVTGQGTYVNPLTGRDFMSTQVPVSNYWNLETAGLDFDTHASGKTTHQMQLFSSFLWWDFKGEERNGTRGVWNIGNGRNNGLPYLSWQYPDDPGITAEFDGGTGTENDPFLIGSAEQLALINFQFLSSHDSDPETWHFRLVSDIDLYAAPFNEGEGWVPIGTSQVPHFIPLDRAMYFRGIFDGNGHVIRGVFIHRLGSYQGLFGSVHESEIKDLGVRHVDIMGGTRYIGGLAGELSQSSIDNCYTTGRVQGVGELFFAPTASYSGGLVGNLNDQSVISGSYSKVDVSGYSHAGGLVGNLIASSVSQSFSTGSVTSLGMSGGFAGILSEGASITNSYSHGDVIIREADSEASIGGFAGGVFESRVTNSYATGKIMTLRGAAPGNKGFSGNIDTDGAFHMSGNYWDTESSGQANSNPGDGATGMDTGEMTFPYADEAFSGWDFEDIWAADDDHEGNMGYPYLRQTIPVGAEYEDLTPGGESPGEVTLLRNYPNPFNPATRIEFNLPEAAEVRLEIFNVTGQRVAVLIDEQRQAGRHQVVFDATGLASGVYISRLQIFPETGSHIGSGDGTGTTIRGRAGDVYTRVMTLIK